MTISESPQIDAIRRFWTWFVANADRLKNLYVNSRFQDLTQEMNRELDRVEPQLAWEMGPGKQKPYLLTISSEGNTRLRDFADLMIELAPDLTGWELYSSRPARPAPKVVRLSESGEAFETADWEFIPMENPEKGRLDLVVVGDQLARSDREPALRAVSLYLDQLLGEDTVELWIGEFRVKSPIAAHGEKAYKITELPDYLLWVTHRETNPLRSQAKRVH
jgi:hypothetical protein